MSARSDRTRLKIAEGRAEAEVSTQGGCLTAFRWRDAAGVIDWLRPAPPGDSFAPNDSACFPLVPYSNRIRDGRFRFAGRDCRLRPNFGASHHCIHGHGWLLPWRLVAQSGAGLVLAYEHDGSDWPSPYRAEQRFTLSGGALAVEIAVTNLGDEAMPAGIGLHPYFPRTPACSLTAEVAQMWATDAEVMPTQLAAPPAGADPRTGLQPATAVLDNGFTGFAGRAEIVWPERGAFLAMEADPALGFLVVYTPPGADFFCAEPVSHCTDAINLAAAGRADTGIRTLGPGETFTAAVRLRPQRIATA